MSAWSIHRTREGVRFVEHSCVCHCVTSFELNSDRDTAVPVARCCVRSEAYPINDAKFAAILKERRGATQDAGGASSITLGGAVGRVLSTFERWTRRPVEMPTPKPMNAPLPQRQSVK
jgi:hypothetical protein